MKYIPLIIVLLLILAILVLVFYGVSRVKRFSRQLFGTDDIIQGVKKHRRMPRQHRVRFLR